MAPDPRDPSENPTARNEVSGQVDGHLVQAHTIHGDVTFHAPADRQPEIPLHVSAYQHDEYTTMLTIGSERMPLPVGAELVVEAFTAQAVILRRLRPVVDVRQPPRPCSSSSATGAALPPRIFTTDLDVPTPVLVPQPPLYQRPQGPLPDFPFTVTASDPERFRILVESEDEVWWHLELDWSSTGRQGTVRIDNEGELFHYHPGRPLLPGTPAW